MISKYLTLPETKTPESSLSDFGQRISQALVLRKRSQAWLAQELGISKQAMQYLVKHATKSKYVSEIATLLNINPQYLKTGEGILLSESSLKPSKIPILKLEEIELRDTLELDHRVMITIDETLSSEYFAIKLENTSMEPLFTLGSILLFDANRQPQSGDYIVLKLVETSEILVRQFLIDGNDVYFKALDTMYRFIRNERYEIFGVLVESRNSF